MGVWPLTCPTGNSAATPPQNRVIESTSANAHVVLRGRTSTVSLTHARGQRAGHLADDAAATRGRTTHPPPTLPAVPRGLTLAPKPRRPFQDPSGVARFE